MKTNCAEDGTTSWALYDDDKPIKGIAWAEVAKQQASALIWNRRHPRQQPLDTPTRRFITAFVQCSVSLSPQKQGLWCRRRQLLFHCLSPPYRLLPARVHKMFLCPPPLTSLMQQQPSHHQYSLTPLHHHSHANQLRMCSRLTNSLVPCHPFHHLLPWTLTWCPCPMKSPMQLQQPHLHHHTQRLRVCTSLFPMKSLMQWQPSCHPLPWMLTLSARPVKSPMQWQFSH